MQKSKSHKVNVVRMALDCLDEAMLSPNLDRLLSPLGQALNACAETIENAKKSGDQVCARVFEDDEAEIARELIGCCFVVCQPYVAAVVSRVKELHRLVAVNGVTLSTTDGTPKSVMAFGSKKVDESGYSEIQVVHFFANYFKHREQWPSNWDELSNNQRPTAEALHEVGALERRSDGLDVDVGKLGFPLEGIQARLFDICRSWRKTLKDAYEDELIKRKLIGASA